MSARPRGLFAMDQYARRQAFPAWVITALQEFADIDPDVLVTDWAAHDQTQLASAEFVITAWGCPVVTPDVVQAMPKLRIIAHAAGTVKHHLSPAVWQRDIAVSTAAAANAEPVAEYTRAMVLLALKRVFVRVAEYRAGGWPSDAQRDNGYVNRTVGIIGASRIGRRTLELLRGYDMNLLVADPYCDAATAKALGARLVDLDELCKLSDVVSVHAPQLPQTRHLLNDRRLSLMRDGASVINTSRGSLIDTEALVAHCSSGRLDAVLDVTEPEPLPPAHPLLQLPNVMVTPHVAGAQGSEIGQLGQYAIAEVRRFFADEQLTGQVHATDLTTMA